MMFGGVMYTPDKFVGGDDPGTVIRALVMRDNDMQASAMRLLTFIAALIKQSGGELRIEKETIDALPPRFGLHHRHDATGAMVLSIVPVSEKMMAEAMEEPKEPGPEQLTDESKSDASN